MSQILQKIRDVDPNKSDAVKEALTPFFANLPKHKETDCITWLRALADVIDRFPKYCISNRTQIESHLILFLDCTNYSRVIEAAKCAHLLQRVRPTKEKTATPQSCWRDQMLALCTAAHKLLRSIFPYAFDIYDMDKLQQEHPTTTQFITSLSNIDSTNSMNKENLLCTRLKNVFIFIQAMLVEIYPVAKPIRPQIILDLIMRAFNIAGSTGTGSLEELVVAKTQAYRTLDALIACLGSNLIPYSPLIFRMTMNTLRWSSENPTNESRKVRASAYNSLAQWLSVLHTHRPAQDRGKQSWEADICNHILDDISPPKQAMEIQMNVQSTKNLSKRAKRALANSMLPGNAVTTAATREIGKPKISEEVDDEVAIAALEFAEIFFTACGIFLKPSTYQRLQTSLLGQCYALPLVPLPRRRHLLRCVEASRRAAPQHAPPHTQHALQLYSTLVSCEDREIANFCSRALLDIRMHLFCSPQPLGGTRDVTTEPEEDERADKRKLLSERNRAALAGLLGVDKVPTQSDSEEAIVIPDEPSNKRQKLDETDNISISSESAASVVISDDSDTESSAVQEVVEVVIENASIADNIVPNNDETSKPEETVVKSRNNDEMDGKERQIQQYSANEKISKDNLHNEVTQDIIDGVADVISDDRIDSTQPEPMSDPTVPIHEANTQMPSRVSNDDEEETPLSMEVAYDFPNTNTEKVPVLEKLEGENIPSSCETDDVQITCGQDLIHSQDDTEKKSDADAKSAEIKVNGIAESPGKPLQNGDVNENIADPAKGVTVEDMLADFVDEVNEDTQAKAT